MASELHIAEKKRIEAAIKHTLESISGEGIVNCLDQEPTRRYSIGILAPQKPDDIQAGKTSNRRTPNSIGIEASITKAAILDIQLEVAFAIYWRAVPSWSEQLEMIPLGARENLSSSDGETRLRLKYCREEISIGPINITTSMSPDNGVESIDSSPVNNALSKRLNELSEEIIKNDACWPSNTKEMPIPISILESEEKYNAYIKSNLLKRTPEKPKWSANISIKLWPVDSGSNKIAILLSNSGEENADAKHPQALLSSSFKITLVDNSFLSLPFAAAALDYRYKSESWGRGINCVLTVSKDNKVAETQTTPFYYQPRTMTRSEMNDACSFSRLSGSNFYEALDEIGTWLDKYALDWREDNKKYISDSSYSTRANDLIEYEEEVARYREGINALHEDERLSESFRMANQAFSSGQHPGWRLFQLVYVVTQMTSLLARENQRDDLVSALNRVDVLWFPTGGGKTEAYFGVIATALFYDRLRGKKRGVTAWLRYPLRMLSIQQLQRLLEIVVYADTVRKNADDPKLRNGVPFSLGYYVGEKNTPNNLTSSFDNPPNKKLIELRQRVEESVGSNDNPLLVLQRCPFCQSDDLGTEVNVDTVRIIHRCNNCKNELPIYITDTEIYRYTPSIIVGTVDRLARAGQTSQFAHLFGKVYKACPDHGYVSFDQCLEKAVCRRKVSEYTDVEELYDPTPALLLQDELHLLRESLGTYDSHYETFLDVLSDGIGNNLPPKRLAATATIEGYKNHINELYARDAVRFPVKGMRESESAYVMPSDKDPEARIYIGILPTGSETKEVVANILTSIKSFSDKHEKDNDADDTAKTLSENYDLSLAYVNQKNTAGDLRSNWNDNEEIQVLTGDRGLSEVRASIGRVESDPQRTFSERLKFLIATSVISHGVDLERLNFMAFAGLPGAASDYIQASSRVGRTHMGVVFTVFKPESNRERNVYQRFHEYHERLYQLVQPIPINRVSQAAISRTITGILGACILNILGYGKGFAVGGYDKGKTFAKALADGMISDEELIELTRRSFGIDRIQLPGDSLTLIDDHIMRLVKDERRLIQQEEDYSTSRRMRPNPVSSLREVSEQVGFELTYQSGEVVAQLLKRKDS